MIAEDENRGPEWVLLSRNVCVPDGCRPAAVLIRGEKIVGLTEHGATPASWPIVDVGEHFVLPGLVETHAHVNEPGRTEWEGFDSATRAAAAGGITTLIDMPLNSRPVTTTLEALLLKQQAAAGQTWVDCGLHAGIVPGNAQQVKPLLDAGVCAFKAFLCHSGIDEFPNATESDLRAVMPILAEAGVPLFVHAELVRPLPEKVRTAFLNHPKSYAAYLATRPPEWELAAIRLLIRLCRDYRCAVHIVHLSAAEAARPLILEAKKAGLPITVETCPHYLYFMAESIADGDTRFKCAPPIRDMRQRDCLRYMVELGEIDTIGSDHSPAPPALKHLEDGDLSLAWGGIASLQLLLPAFWSTLQGSHVSRASRVARLLAANPARLVGLDDRKGALVPGRDADLIVFDPNAVIVVQQHKLYHRHKATPYHGCTLQGRVEMTVLRGRKVFEHDTILGEPQGCLLERAAWTERGFSWPTWRT
ncbi:MAG TPA: allantoinase AllB [Gemmataceae bacterium]|jgi:allantoinase|nr:allantoinase AllB [Gemmataceae bacterium]